MLKHFVLKGQCLFIYLKFQQHNFNSKSLKQNPVAQSDAAFCGAEGPAFKQQWNARDDGVSTALARWLRAAQSIALSATPANHSV